MMFQLVILLLVGFLTYVGITYKEALFRTFSLDPLKGVDARIPRTPSLWFFGCALYINPYLYIKSFTDWNRTLGDIICFHIFGVPHVVVTDADLAKEILVSPDLKEKQLVYYDIIKDFLGSHSLVLVGGEEWRFQRNILLHVFHLKNMQYFIKEMADATSEFLSILSEHIDNNTTPHIQGGYPSKSFDVDQACIALTLDVISRTMFSKRFNIQRDTSKSKLISEVTIGTIELENRLFNPFRKYFWLYHGWRFEKANQYLKTQFKEIILQHREELKNADETKFLRDLVHLMIEAKDSETGEGLSDEDIRDQCITFFFAGNDTTARTLAWTIYMISEHPEVEQQLIREIDSVLGSREFPDHSDVGRLEYTSMIIKEALRMFPPVRKLLLNCRTYIEAALPRVASKDTYFGPSKLFIPKGTVVGINMDHLHKHPKYWEDPLTFNPSRFQNEMSNLFSWLPFSSKERNCIGQNFALMEMKVVLCMTYKKYVFRVDRHRPVGIKTKLTLQPADGLWLFPVRRSQ